MKKREGSACRVITPDEPDYCLQAAAVIRAGGVVAIPTETCFGLAVDPFNLKALDRLFTVKKRSPAKPVLVLIECVKYLDRLVREIPEPYDTLIENHWPGPLTLIFPALSHLPLLLTGGTNTVGVRISSNSVATEICRNAGGIITATSANISGCRPSCTATEIIESLGGVIDLVVASEISQTSHCSTIVAEKEGNLDVIRAGQIEYEDLVNSTRS
jgi:L-threonylcarbamoyladenylate synthase